MINDQVAEEVTRVAPQPSSWGRGVDLVQTKSVESQPSILTSAAAPVTTGDGNPRVLNSAPAPVLSLSPEELEFQSQLTERVRFLVSQGVNRATVTLRPASLGEVAIQIDYQDDGARVQFQTPSQVAREALELAIPRLRDLFDSAGVRLQEAQVGGQADHRGATTGQQPQQQNSTTRTELPTKSTLDEVATQLPANARPSNETRLIDTYV
ncbi:MAG: flagellar hook-length control protein FliK [Planctomycetota bacterium]